MMHVTRQHQIHLILQDQILKVVRPSQVIGLVTIWVLVCVRTRPVSVISSGYWLPWRLSVKSIGYYDDHDNDPVLIIGKCKN